ncbi:MAG: hypothetical protein GY784_11015 [Gammaproteobacteria bacterium]|nr:hypothetical protein [Gammaproteobacteria bacterium]
MKEFLSILVSCALLPGCASTLKIESMALDGQQETYRQGVKNVISPKTALVAVRPTTSIYSSEDRPTFVVSVLNGTEKSFNFSTENIRVYVGGTPHQIFTYDELVAEAKRRTWGIPNSAGQPAGAANNTYSSNYSSGFSPYPGYIYNAVSAQQMQTTATAQTSANIQAIREQAMRLLSRLKSTMLKKATVFPQAWHGGFVTMAEIPDSVQPLVITVTISAAGENHTFVLRQSKVGR